MSKYFQPYETMCKCGCGGNNINPRLLEVLDQMREECGGPLELSCAYRCPTHNKEVGGVSNSQHTLGNAADILCPDFLTIDQLAWYAKRAGADGVGKYYDSGFLHIDVREGGVNAGYYWEE